MSSGSSDEESQESGFFGGINELVDRLTELAEAAESLDETVERSGGGDELDGVWGVRVRTGLGDTDDLSVREFGNVRDDDGESVVVDDVREPMVDVFDEGSTVLVVAEMPGASETDLELEIDGDLLVVAAETDEVTYRSEVLLPENCSGATPQIEANNGIFRIALAPN